MLTSDPRKRAFHTNMTLAVLHLSKPSALLLKMFGAALAYTDHTHVRILAEF